MIDAHVHVVEPRLPGDPHGLPLLERPPEAIAAELRQQMKEAGVTRALGMGRWGAPPDDPLGINGTLRLAALVPGLHPIGIADPTRTDAEHLRRVEAELKRGRVKALKAYLGYVHHGPGDPGYVPYYELAARFKIPVVLHTGDTYSPRAKVRFAHPLLVDEVAVDHHEVRFVLAHLGNPWLTDAAEVLYKNENVWADLSGILVGDREDFAAEEHQDGIRDAAEGVRKALRYAEKWDRIVYGSDWPLAPMSSYRRFVESLIPERHRPAVFEENARALFALP